jgi:hypothetical protein
MNGLSFICNYLKVAQEILQTEEAERAYALIPDMPDVNYKYEVVFASDRFIFDQHALKAALSSPSNKLGYWRLLGDGIVTRTLDDARIVARTLLDAEWDVTGIVIWDNPRDPNSKFTGKYEWIDAKYL